ncbi:MAG TPA: HEAT repeat domain-containing protein [Candidatus Binatia bacterium]|nr:HEAT repeat domain-containing protein [Candidatus Binatia bacterium]
MKTNLLNRLFVIGLLALAVSGVRADEEQDLITLLKSNAGVPEKCDACQKLRLIGTVRAVPVLATLLSGEQTAHASRYALEGMPFPEAVAALREALGSTSGSIKAGLIDSLGWRHDTAAVPLLGKALPDADPTVAAAAAVALGRIGGKEAVAALTDMREKAPAAVQPALLGGLSRCADQFLAGGDANEAAALYRTLSTSEISLPIRVAAWRGLVMADAGGRAELVYTALAGQEHSLHAAALKVLRELKDASVLEVCQRRWSTLAADAQLAVLDARLKLGGDVLPFVRTATQSPYLPVRVAAWQALGDLADPMSIPTLGKTAAGAEPGERDAARESLARVHGAGVREALLKDLAGAEPPEKVELLRALGERGDADAATVLLANAAAEPKTVRLAALESLRKIAQPGTAAPLLVLAAKSKSEAECEPVLKALYAVCESGRDTEQTAAAILGAMKPLPAAERRLVLPVLPELGTPAALELALAATREQDTESVKQAVSVLAQWPNATPAESLVELAHLSADPNIQVLALRGCIDVAAQEPDSAKRLAWFQQVMATAKRAEEKKQALGQIGQVPTPAALQLAMSHLGDAELANEAGLAAVTIAEKVAGSDPKLAREAAAKLLTQCKSPEIVRRAWAIRGKVASEVPFVQDWLVCGPYGKPGVTGAKAVFDLVFAPEQPGETVPWKSLPHGNMAELSAFFPDQVNCVAYLKTQIIAPRSCDATLLLGSDDGVKAWVNGIVVFGNNVDRGLVVDQDMAPIQLKQGVNELMLKISQGGGGWQACARIVGVDGQPIVGLKYHAER